MGKKAGRGRGRGRGGRGGGGDDDDDDSSAPSSPTSPIAAIPIGLNLNMFNPDGTRKESGATITFAKPNYQKGARDIQVDKLDLHFRGHNILEDATLNLTMGHRYALVGTNGCGKTTLMRCLGLGEVPFPEGTDWFYLDQEVEAFQDVSALQCVLKSNVEKDLLEKEQDELHEMDQDSEYVITRLDAIYARLDELEQDSAEHRAAKILFGLGFDAKMQTQPTASFSGGWRMRISLAQALFQNPTILLLDEPTNHLDVEAVVWLERYLAKFNKILFMVSHSQDFMNSVCTNIIHMHLGKLNLYEGNYDSYCSTREERDTNQQKRFEHQQTQIKDMKEYIARFGHGNAKLARQAQSKEKVLNKMVRSGLEQSVSKDPNINFKFPCSGSLPPPLVQFTDVSFAYPNCKSLFQNLNFGLDMDSRICLVGKNGAGKSTLSKLMTRDLEPTAGYVTKNAHCTVARFHQHFADQINGELTPLQWLHEEYPDVLQAETLRGALGRMGVSGRLQGMPICELSDGQKTRCVFAWMAFKQPHFMILDEPTNHLDMDGIDALAAALNQFEGAVVVISHDMRLIAQIAEEIWIVDEGKVVKFNGDIADYKEVTAKAIAKMEAELDSKKKPGAAAAARK